MTQRVVMRCEFVGGKVDSPSMFPGLASCPKIWGFDVSAELR